MYKKSEYEKVKICLVSLNSYPLLIENKLGYIGGAEIQQVELAKELNRRGYEISFITYGQNTSNKKLESGIVIFPAYDRNTTSHLRILKKAFIIYKKMKAVNADIYFYRAGSPGAIPIFAKLLHKKVIKSIASDAEVTGEIIIRKNSWVSFLEKVGNWIDIKLSNVVVSQNNFQKSELKRIFRTESVLIKNAFHIPSHVSTGFNKDCLLWIGTIRSVKQPHLFLEVAMHFPRYKFTMIGGEGEDPELFRNIKNEAEKIPNLDFIGFVPHDKIFDYYMKAILLINTSITEGFPNIFLEAWSSSIPVISLNVDPDGIISKYKLGYHSKTFKQMLDDIKTLLEDKELLKMIGINGRKYVEENHNIKKIVDQYEALIQNMIK